MHPLAEFGVDWIVEAGAHLAQAISSIAARHLPGLRIRVEGPPHITLRYIFPAGSGVWDALEQLAFDAGMEFTDGTTGVGLRPRR